MAVSRFPTSKHDGTRARAPGCRRSGRARSNALRRDSEVLLASDMALDTLVSQPGLALNWMAGRAGPLLPAGDEGQWPCTLAPVAMPNPPAWCGATGWQRQH